MGSSFNSQGLIYFIQQTKYISHGGKTEAIIQNVTIDSSEGTIYKKKFYNCTIIGDGKIQHFGDIFP